MRLRSVVAAAVLCSSLALAEEPQPQPQPKVALPGWMIGKQGGVAGLAAGTSNAPPAPAGPAASPAKQQAPVPAPAGECVALPTRRAGPLPFEAGESLVYDVDVMGVRAGKLEFDVLPPTGKGPTAEVPVHVRAATNTFFEKVRRIEADATSYLRVKDLHPRKFVEKSHEGEAIRSADVDFADSGKLVTIDWKNNANRGQFRHLYANDALDYVGAMYFFRGVNLRVGQPFCFEVYAMRRLWRMTGTVEAREHLSTPAGEFDALHLKGNAVRIGAGPMQREVHIWVSDDARRLPVAAIGIIDLGPVRATLASVNRPDMKVESAKKDRGNMNW